MARQIGQRVAGWKIAATSVAGQVHIGVDGPLAGRLFEDRVLPRDAAMTLDGNAMRLAEAEFAFRMGRSLPPRNVAYSVLEVVDAVAAFCPAIELPDSRFEDAARAGGLQLIADDACACWVKVGDADAEAWRAQDLSIHTVRAFRNGILVEEGGGANVLGDPRVALAWLVSELTDLGETLHAGDIVITGTCVPPVPVSPGDHVRMDFGALGALEAAFS